MSDITKFIDLTAVVMFIEQAKVDSSYPIGDIIALAARIKKDIHADELATSPADVLEYLNAKYPA